MMSKNLTQTKREIRARLQTVHKDDKNTWRKLKILWYAIDWLQNEDGTDMIEAIPDVFMESE